VPERPELKTLKKGKIPWVLIAIIVAAAILAGLIWWLPQTPQRQTPPAAAQVPQQPTANQIQLTNLAVQHAPVGAAFYLSGILHNQGNTEISGVQVEATFLGVNGAHLETQTRPMVGFTGPNENQAQNFAQSPILPNQSRPFRIYFDHYPSGWNQQIPELKITTVTAAPSKPQPPNPPSPRVG
jgi:hypothetical protein